MARKRWQVEEFTKKAGLGLPQFRETVQRQVLEFLDKENLAPKDCCITWHIEPYGQTDNTRREPSLSPRSSTAGRVPRWRSDPDRTVKTERSFYSNWT